MVLGFTVLLWGETLVGEKARIVAKNISNEFNFQTDVDKFLDGVFNTRARLVAGLITGICAFVVYDLLGFWYNSLLIIMLGRIFAFVLGFVVGEQIVAANNLLFGTRDLAVKLIGRIDILDYSHTSKVDGLASVCLQSASLGGLAGFFALFGMLFAPWRSARPLAEIPILDIGALLLLCLVIFVVPMNAIHKVLAHDQEEKKLKISEKIVELYSSVAIDSVKISVGSMEALRTLKEQLDKATNWPFDMKKAVGYVTPIIGVIIETLILIMLGRL